MKESKTILNQRIALSLLLQIAVVVIIALPELEPYRDQISEQTSFSKTLFWIPLLGLLFLLQLMILSGIGKKIVAPLEELVNQTKLGAKSIAFQKKSKNLEEDHLKHFIESQALRAIDLEAEVNRVELELERISQVAKTPPEEIDAMRAQIETADQAKADLKEKIEEEKANTAEIDKKMQELRRQLKAKKLELETVLFNQKKAGFEAVESNEVETQTETETQVDDDSPLPTSLIDRLLTPLNLINNLSWRLAKSWEETPPAKIREGLEEISKQSEDQIELLKQHRNRDNEE